MYQHYAVGVPSGEVSDQEFQYLLDIIACSKEQLETALGMEDLAVIYLKNRLWFPWFASKDSHCEIDEYYYLIDCLCDLARKYPHCSKAFIKREVQWLLWEIGLDKAPGILGQFCFDAPAFVRRWHSRITHILSDIQTCFFKRFE